MKDIPLRVSSILGALFFSVHLAQDFIFGIDSMTKAGTFTYLTIILLWLYAPLELGGRRWGYVIMLLAGVLASGLPVLHYVGGPRSIARGFFFVWSLLGLGATGVFSAAVAARELIASFRAPRLST